LIFFDFHVLVFSHLNLKVILLITVSLSEIKHMTYIHCYNCPHRVSEEC